VAAATPPPVLDVLPVLPDLAAPALEISSLRLRLGALLRAGLGPVDGAPAGGEGAGAGAGGRGGDGSGGGGGLATKPYLRERMWVDSGGLEYSWVLACGCQGECQDCSSWVVACGGGPPLLLVGCGLRWGPVLLMRRAVGALPVLLVG
jgi:hypothetical protein